MSLKPVTPRTLNVPKDAKVFTGTYVRVPTGVYPASVTKYGENDNGNIVLTCEIASGEQKGNTVDITLGTNFEASGNVTKWTSLYASLGVPVAKIRGATFEISDKALSKLLKKPLYLKIEDKEGERFQDRSFITKAAFDALSKTGVVAKPASVSKVAQPPADEDISDSIGESAAASESEEDPLEI